MDTEDTQQPNEPTQADRIDALRAEYRERRYPTLNPQKESL